MNSEEENSKAEPEVAKDEADGQVLPFLTERISVPELLFRPGNGGLPQGGVVDAIMQCVRSCHPDLQGPLLNNILVVGGNACIPNFRERLESQTRQGAVLVQRQQVGSAAMVLPVGSGSGREGAPHDACASGRGARPWPRDEYPP